jgi:hypothetical protein
MNSKTGYQKSIVEDLEYATTDLIFKFKDFLGQASKIQTGK